MFSYKLFAEGQFCQGINQTILLTKDCLHIQETIASHLFFIYMPFLINCRFSFKCYLIVVVVSADSQCLKDNFS